MKRHIYYIIGFLLLAFASNAQEMSGSDNFESYDLTKYYNVNNIGDEPVFLGESPMNEATVQVFSDGTIKIYHAPNR